LHINAINKNFKEDEMKKICLIVLIAFVTIAFAGEVMAKELTLAGSTTVQKRVLEPAKEKIASATGIDIAIRGTGSGKGFAELMDGKIEASIASSPLASLLSKKGLSDDGTYQEHIIIQDVIVPIVHKSNPVSELTWEQLSDINTGKITNWKEVGGEDQKIVVVTSHKESATRAVFQKKVMKKANYAEGKRVVKSTRQEVGLVSKFKGGIGAVSEGFVAMNPGKVKVIKANKISRPLSIITKGDPNPDVQSLINYLKTPDAQKLYK
jgi:phosphate transport system substrate-binding protein